MEGDITAPNQTIFALILHLDSILEGGVDGYSQVPAGAEMGFHFFSFGPTDG